MPSAQGGGGCAMWLCAHHQHSRLLHRHLHELTCSVAICWSAFSMYSGSLAVYQGWALIP